MIYQIDPKYNCLDRMKEWDQETQDVIKKRLEKEIGEKLEFKFLSDKEGTLLKSITDILIIQKKDEPYVKIAEAIDRSLSDKKFGVRYGNDPWKGELYKKGLAELLKSSEKISEKSVGKLIDENNSFILQVLLDATRIYYSHPATWNQIGFPGPAYPEGYAYLDCGEADEWEPKFIEK